MFLRGILIVFLLCGGTLVTADAWDFFHPGFVINYRCSVSEVQMTLNGVSRSEAVWEAQASAQRKAEPNWSMTVGIFPLTLKGRHAAEKACSRWMDEASKRVKQAKP